MIIWMMSCHVCVCYRGSVNPQFTRQLELEGVGRDVNVELKFIVYQVEDERRVKVYSQTLPTTISHVLYIIENVLVIGKGSSWICRVNITLHIGYSTRVTIG
jgi:hypothetical protein